MVYFPIDPATVAARARAAHVPRQTVTLSQAIKRAIMDRNLTVAIFLQLKTQEDSENRIMFDAANKFERDLISAVCPRSTDEGIYTRGQPATAIAAHKAAHGDQVGYLEYAYREMSRQRTAGVNSAVLWAGDPRRAPLPAAIKAGPVAARAAAMTAHDGAAYAPPMVAEHNPIEFLWAAAKKL